MALNAYSEHYQYEYEKNIYIMFTFLAVSL